jgi:hypothetical protein
MSKGPSFNHGDRVVRTDTETPATYVDRLGDKGWEVLLDDGPKVVTCWGPGTPVERVGPRRSGCDRCGSPDHHAFYCRG